MTNLQKLTELLCEVEEIKEDIMDLRFGTTIILKDYFGEKRITLGSDMHYSSFQVISTIDNQNTYFTRNDIEEIIGNPIEERHLRMYCENKKLHIDTFNINYFYIIKFIGNNKISSPLCKIDNTKSFDKQSEEVLGALVEYLSNIK